MSDEDSDWSDEDIKIYVSWQELQRIVFKYMNIHPVFHEDLYLMGIKKCWHITWGKREE